MIEEGQKAPDFALPGIEDGVPDVYELFRRIEAGDAVLLWFVPTTFVPTATAELRAIRDAGWHGVSGLHVWVLTADTIYAAAAYADRHELPMAFLGDAGGVADAYGVRREEWEGHYDVPERAVFLVDSSWDTVFAWAGQDAFEAIDPSPVMRVSKRIDATFPTADPAGAVDYEAAFD